MQNNLQEFKERFLENLKIELENYPKSEMIINQKQEEIGDEK